MTVSDFRVNTRRKCMAFCSFFPKFEILKVNIRWYVLVHKVFIFSKSLSSMGQLSSRYRQTSIFKTPSDNMFALNSSCAVNVVQFSSTMYHTHHTPMLYRGDKTIEWLLALTCNAHTNSRRHAFSASNI